MPPSQPCSTHGRDDDMGEGDERNQLIDSLWTNLVSRTPQNENNQRPAVGDGLLFAGSDPLERKQVGAVPICVAIASCVRLQETDRL